MTSCKPLKTLLGEPQYQDPVLVMSKNDSLFGEIRKIIFNKNVKGIIVGYPLDNEGKPMLHCNFIERWIEHMWSLGIAKNVPVTLVNEHGSSMQAKVLIAQQIQKNI